MSITKLKVTPFNNVQFSILKKEPGTSGLLLALAYSRVLHKRNERRLQKELEAKRKTSIIDNTTKLYNRGYIEQEHKIVHRAGPSGFLILDIDHFKKVNDTYGHAAGDTVLKHVAKILRESLIRDTDLVGRWGGEEFAFVLPGFKDPIALAGFAETIRAKIAVTKCPLPGYKPIAVTVSIGAAIAYNPREMPEKVIGEADAAMYASKDEGRNRVSVFDNRQFFQYANGNLIKIEDDERFFRFINENLTSVSGRPEAQGPAKKLSKNERA